MPYAHIRKKKEICIETLDTDVIICFKRKSSNIFSSKTLIQSKNSCKKYDKFFVNMCKGLGSR